MWQTTLLTIPQTTEGAANTRQCRVPPQDETTASTSVAIFDHGKEMRITVDLRQFSSAELGD